MSKKCYRFFGGLLVSQEKWLNKMAENGYRLIRTGKLLYEFEECAPKQYQYCVDFVGQKSKESVDDYARFLEDFGYRIFFKNINLDWNVGKVEVRPWAEQGGRLAANSTTYNRELLIVEKENDGKPFELHTTYEDKVTYYKQVRKPSAFLFLLSVIMGIVMQAWPWGIFVVVSAIGLTSCQIELYQLGKQSKTKEW